MRGMLQMGRQQGLRFAVLVRVAHQDPTDGDRRLARVIPDRRVRSDLDLAWAFPFQLSMVSVLHGVFSSANTASRVGRRLP